ncbi:hypothetical protein CLV86_0366 [Lacinutrix venerupis]|nr:hypothetical protein CLV86_0366 [Lacinutrix venerupis]
MKEKQPKYKWNKLYTLILVANIAYIIAFYFITKAF